MDGVAAARQGSGRWRRSTRGRPPRLPTQTKRRRRKKHNACPTVPCACPLPLAPCTLSLAPCPSPEATHNKDELKNDVTSNQRAERVRVRAAVGLAVLTEKGKKKHHRKKRPKKKGKNRPPLPLTLDFRSACNRGAGGPEKIKGSDERVSQRATQTSTPYLLFQHLTNRSAS